MASGHRQLASSVLVTLSAQYPPPDFQHPERRIVLESKSVGSASERVKIGRSSKRLPALEPKNTNALFDSPVMSREHAELIVDWYLKKLYVKDSTSLHGTHRNSVRINAGEPYELLPGDTLKFGVDIQRSSESFPPCTVHVHFQWDPPSDAEHANARPTYTYSVPDDSDSSDNDDDDDIRATMEKIRLIAQHRLPGAAATAIDLTDDTPVPASTAGQSAAAAIVLDDDNAPNHVLVAPAVIPRSSQPVPPAPPATVDFDAPHDDDDEEIPSSAQHSALVDPIPTFDDSDSELDDSYEEGSSMDLSDKDVSSEGQSSDEASDEEDICLSDSLSGSDNGDVISEQDVEVDTNCDVDPEDDEQDSEVDDDAERYADYDDDVREPDADNSDGETDSQDDEYAWDEPTCNNPANDTTMTICEPATASASTNQPTLTPHAFPGPFLCPAMPWPFPGSSEDQFVNDFKLPPLLNQATPKDPSLSNGKLLSGLLQAQPLDIPQSHRPWLSAHGQQPAYGPRGDDWKFASTEEKNPWLSQNDGPSVDVLGQKSGKPEFFAARAHNKAMMLQHEESSKPSPAPVSTQPAATPDQAPDADIYSKPAPVDVEAPKSTKVPESVWTAPGRRFLDSPQEDRLSPEREMSPEPDMTSAFQYQQSKLAVLTQSPKIPETAIAITEKPVQESTPPRSPKRKADEISTLLSEEQATETSTIEHAAQNTVSVVAGEESTASENAPLAALPRPEGTEQPPAKRFRFLPSMNKIGTSSVGVGAGVSMLAGMLAMTAPSL
ncbi:fha domain protein [Colletotrichum kahawae]|uniref:Fha domain protein n=1 Tax=Colletotrichum kahawae TaxID=34407 RepID=A0AAD9Y571_COLKA|nr:fha domain protein [Colletotrichum kahawae]